MPVEAPSAMLNKTSVRAPNALYWRVQRSAPARELQPYERFFYPLDAIGSWNRLYGRRGFYQYQCVVPNETAELAMTELLRQIARAGTASMSAALRLQQRAGMVDETRADQLAFPTSSHKGTSVPRKCTVRQDR